MDNILCIRFETMHIILSPCFSRVLLCSLLLSMNGFHPVSLRSARPPTQRNVTLSNYFCFCSRHNTKSRQRPKPINPRAYKGGEDATLPPPPPKIKRFFFIFFETSYHLHLPFTVAVCISLRQILTQDY